MKKPTIQEIDEEIKLKGYATLDAEGFFHYNEARGWKISKQPMVKWRSCLAAWHRNAMRNTTHYMAIKGRDEAVRASKKVYMAPVKAKPANPKIKELVTEQYSLAKGLRGANASQRILLNKKIRLIRDKIQAIKDEGSKVGNIVT